jgi:hypothetical protein
MNEDELVAAISKHLTQTDPERATAEGRAMGHELLKAARESLATSRRNAFYIVSNYTVPHAPAEDSGIKFEGQGARSAPRRTQNLA